MRTLLIALSTLVATTVMACPNLTGTYQCYDDESGYYMETITQSGNGSNTTYTTSNPEGTYSIVANGKWISVTVDGQAQQYRAYCKGSEFKLDVITKTTQMGEVRAFSTTFINQSGNLATNSTIVIGGQTYPGQPTECVRM